MHHASKIQPIFLTYLAVVSRRAFKHTLDGLPKQGSGALVASSTTDAVGNATKRGDRPNSRKECKYHGGYFNGRVSFQPVFVVFQPLSPLLTSLVPLAQTWSCCGAGAWNQPCMTAEEHKAVEYKPGELEEQYRYYRTPDVAPGSKVHRAVASESPCHTPPSMPKPQCLPQTI